MKRFATLFLGFGLMLPLMACYGPHGHDWHHHHDRRGGPYMGGGGGYSHR
ncbi:hypothetical protein [Gluconobacter frateurii]|uniref:Lipoprotein n=1 Tax=Gluconobacter frateurii NRIC 0228 TaxID=1307946 RepID=A0ABQ0Q9K9_9PROT|nr:hypothetical protein [Gluconobacter frateurii]GBR10067.1 hypothetical protein AA0228_0907 [Gluconobacter frateurii NRIC 0228]GLP91726.1 hypothetical protein GCM10007868_28010 [Gluconobacter frateurii]